MSSWFIVPITGDGLSPATAFSATTTSDVKSHCAIIATNASGAPKFNWVLINAHGATFTSLTSISGVFQMPSPTLSTFGSLNASQVAQVNQALSFYSIAVSPTAVQTLLSVINRIGQVQEPTFDVSTFYTAPNAVP